VVVRLQGLGEASRTHVATGTRRGIGGFVLALVLLVAFAPGAGAYIYWANGATNTIGRANLDGSGVNNSFVAGAMSPCGVAVDAGYVYWAQSTSGPGGVGRASLSTQGAQNSFVIGKDPLPCGVAVDAGHVYWDNYIVKAIARANIDGGEPSQEFIDPAGENPQMPAVDAGHVYWVNKSGHSIGRANLDGSNIVELVKTENAPVGVAVDAAHVYWAEPGGWIGRATLTGSEPQPHFISGGGCGVAVDATHIYWGTYGGWIGRANLDGTGVEPNFVATSGKTCGVAVDAGAPAGGPSGGSAPPPNCDPILGTCDQSLIVCVGLWTSVCPGPLPAPPPVQTCVSLFESCNGFGSSAATPGQIDMSGFPTTLTTSAGCQASSGAFAAASPASPVAHPPRGPSPRAADSSTGNALQGARCILKAVVETTDQAKADQALKYLEDLQSFRNSDIAAARASILEGLNYLCTPSSGAPETTCFNARVVKAALTVKLEAVLAAAGEEGKSVVTAFGIPTSVCAAQTPMQPCVDIVAHLQASVEATLRELAARKHELGLDLPPPSASGSRLHAAASARRKYRRPGLLVLASGYGVVAQHSRSTLRLTIGPRVRRLLRAECRRGVKLLAVTVVVQATIVPGVQSSKSHRSHVTLVKHKAKGKR
jgi:virginiamycin B lyase